MILTLKIIATIIAFFASAGLASAMDGACRDCDEIPWDLVAFFGSMIILTWAIWIK